MISRMIRISSNTPPPMYIFSLLGRREYDAVTHSAVETNPLALDHPAAASNSKPAGQEEAAMCRTTSVGVPNA